MTCNWLGVDWWDLDLGAVHGGGAGGRAHVHPEHKRKVEPSVGVALSHSSAISVLGRLSRGIAVSLGLAWVP